MTSFPAAYIARLHTVCAATAFLSALVIGSALHYRKIVKNDVAQYPDEWFPSVSATYEPFGASFQSVCNLFTFHSIGDWFPERNLFQILIAITSGTCSRRPPDALTKLFNQDHAFALFSSSTISTVLLPHFFQQLFSFAALYEHFHAEVGSTSPPLTTTTSTTS